MICLPYRARLSHQPALPLLHHSVPSGSHVAYTVLLCFSVWDISHCKPWFGQFWLLLLTDTFTSLAKVGPLLLLSATLLQGACLGLWGGKLGKTWAQVVFGMAPCPAHCPLGAGLNPERWGFKIRFICLVWRKIFCFRFLFFFMLALKVLIGKQHVHLC